VLATVIVAELLILFVPPEKVKVAFPVASVVADEALKIPSVLESVTA